MAIKLYHLYLKQYDDVYTISFFSYIVYHYVLYIFSTPTQNAVLFRCLLSGLVTTTVDCLTPKMGNGIKRLSQWHSGALRHR